MTNMKVDIDAPKRPVLKYYGGKHSISSWIISYFPTHRNYIEPCGGSAAVLIQKPPSPLEIYNDQEKHIVNFFRVLRENTSELIRLIRYTPYSRYEYEIARQPADDPLEDARRFFIGSWLSISCAAFEKSTGMRVCTDADQSYSQPAHQLRNAEEELEKIANRFRFVQIENDDAMSVIKRYDKDDGLIYFDPPYVRDTRATKNQYIQEVDDGFHLSAFEVLQSCKSYVIVSGYASKLYAELYENSGWVRVDKDAQTNSGGWRTESLWLSPKTVKALNIPSQTSFI